IVQQVLLDIPYQERDITKGLHLSFDVSLSSYTNSKEYNARCGLHLVYHARTNYVTVFSGITSSPFSHPALVQEWKHESTHDSCWRDVNTFSDLYFRNAEIVNTKRQQDGLKAIAPKNMSQNVFFSRLDSVWSWIPVEITKDPEDEYKHRRILKVL